MADAKYDIYTLFLFYKIGTSLVLKTVNRYKDFSKQKCFLPVALIIKDEILTTCDKRDVYITTHFFEGSFLS